MKPGASLRSALCKAFCLAGLFAVFAAATVSAQEALQLSAGELRVSLSRATGGLTAITNGYTGRSVAVEDGGGTLVFDGFEIDLGRLAFAPDATAAGERRGGGSSGPMCRDRFMRDLSRRTALNWIQSAHN